MNFFEVERVRQEDQSQWGAWMAQAQDGDADAYRRLLAAIAPTVRRIVGKRIADPDQGEDVVQEVMMSVHKNRHTYDPALAFGPWLGTIAKRRVMDWLRQHYRRGDREVLVDEYPETFLDDAANTVEDAALAFDDVDRLHQVIQALPPGQRQAVEMLKLKEMSLKEASDATGMSVAALKVAMHRAVKTLRTEMAKFEMSETKP